MKEKVKLAIQKGIFWMVVLLGILATLCLTAFIASHFISNLQLIDIAWLEIVPFFASTLAIKRKRKVIQLKLIIALEQNKFIPFCFVWLFRTMLITFGALLLSCIFGVIIVLFFYFFEKIIEWITRRDLIVLTSDTAIAFMFSTWSTTVYLFYDNARDN
ncbi:MAG: hypothetical protein ACI4OW_01555 [Alphaproteobacteria bacterium]